MAFPLDKAQLLALFLENIAFGVFLTVFIILVTIGFARDKIRLANPKFVLSVATVMMILATVHLIIDFVRVMQGFTTGEATVLPNPIPYYADVANPLDITKNFIYTFQTVLGDAVLVWRCYIVYDKSLYVLIPAGIVLLGNVALTILITWSFLGTTPMANYYQTDAWKFVASFINLTIGLNICCTVAIVFRVWRTHRLIKSNCGRSLFPIIAVIIESGAIYTASIASLVITFLLRSNAQYPALDLITPLVGVVFCLIVLQIHLQLRLLKPSTTNMCSRSIQFGRGESERVEFSECGNAIAVQISEHIFTDQESVIGLDPKTV